MRRSEIKRYRVNFVVMVSTPDVRYELQFTCYLMIWGCCEMLEWVKLPKHAKKELKSVFFLARQGDTSAVMRRRRARCAGGQSVRAVAGWARVRSGVARTSAQWGG